MHLKEKQPKSCYVHSEVLSHVPPLRDGLFAVIAHLELSVVDWTDADIIFYDPNKGSIDHLQGPLAVDYRWIQDTCEKGYWLSLDAYSRAHEPPMDESLGVTQSHPASKTAVSAASVDLLLRAPQRYDLPPKPPKDIYDGPRFTTETKEFLCLYASWALSHDPARTDAQLGHDINMLVRAVLKPSDDWHRKSLITDICNRYLRFNLRRFEISNNLSTESGYTRRWLAFEPEPGSYLRKILVVESACAFNDLMRP
ncbi:hypothetical protein BKA62DRAFT_223030 [Auriculariales sp. MPI-PUGE-AT-0066]|nr:hypothetical protein BKA62DRAFT_223030 [Auriculariales sp. MPI-PUGE-AT-0066]